MEKHPYGFAVICFILVSLGLLAFSACIAAEFKRTGVKDLKLDDKLCYVPKSPAFGFGLAALICLLVAQMIANLIIGGQFLLKEKKSSDKARKQKMAITLLLLSWISFGFAIILLGTATSMSQRQPYKTGWLDGDCYIVKDGVYAASGALVLGTVIFALCSIFLVTSTRLWREQVEQGKRVHAQA